MRRRRSLSRLVKRVRQDWPRWAQVAGLLAGTEQVLAWWVAGREPNIGVMTFAGALIMFQRASRRDEH